MAIIAKFTRTLPAPTATISGGFVFLLSAGWFTQANTGVAGSPIDGGANSIANGGGDMQIFSDTATTTRLPIEVVAFVTGGSPQCQVWVRTPSYTSGDTITIGKDDTQTTQPAVGAAFGRNAVWIDFDYISHGGVSDSTGNSSITQFGAPSVGVNPWGGDSAVLNGSSQYGRATTSKTPTFTNYISAWIKPSNTANERSPFGAFVSSSGGDWHNLNFKGGVNSYWMRNQVSSNTQAADSIATIALNVWSEVSGTSFSNIDRRAFTDGSNKGANTSLLAAMNLTLDRFSYGRRDDSSPNNYFQGEISEMWIDTSSSRSDEFVESRYLNLSNPDNFGTSSEYVLLGGGGISLTVTLGTIEYNSNDSAVSLAGSMDVTATLGSINYSSSDASIQLSGDVNVIATLGAIDYTSNDTSISLFGDVDIVTTLGTINYNSNDAGISLVGGINVTATLGVIDYASNNSVITLQGQIPVTATLGTITYDSYNVTVQIGIGQFIGTVTASFANDIYSAGFKPSAITVNFKS